MADGKNTTIIFDIQEPEGVRIRSRAGVGRRSQWYEAEQVRLTRTVAAKFLRPLLATSEPFRQAFINAGRQAASIVHPAAIPIINIYAQQNCIVSQWCTDKPLRELEGALDPVAVLRLGDSVMDCLASLHATGRCHGNLSPGNVFSGERGEVWIDDFFQPAVMSDKDRIFMSDQRFIAPELLTTGGTRASWVSDVFSLGRLLEYAANPEFRADEMHALFTAMQSTDPANRGETPLETHQALKRVRRLEEMRRGVDTATSRRGKRMYRRIPAEFEVALRRRSASPHETQAILMKTRDIGESGVFVETSDTLIGVGSIVELDITLKGVEGNVHAFGIVRWRSAPPLPMGVGVQFVEVDQAGLARLRQFLVKRGE